MQNNNWYENVCKQSTQRILQKKSFYKITELINVNHFPRKNVAIWCFKYTVKQTLIIHCPLMIWCCISGQDVDHKWYDFIINEPDIWTVHYMYKNNYTCMLVKFNPFISVAVVPSEWVMDTWTLPCIGNPSFKDTNHKTKWLQWALNQRHFTSWQSVHYH